MADVEMVARAIPDEAVEKALLVFYDGKLTIEEMWRINGEDLRLAMRAALEAALAAMGERKPVGLFAALTPEQQEAALAYQGPENLMPSDTPASPRPEAVGEAVKAERDRCARIARANINKMNHWAWGAACLAIEKDIRAEGEKP